MNWQGRTDSYENYGRRHEVAVAGSVLTMSADAAFHGDPGLPNPEQLVVAAASSCQLLSFLAVAAHAGVEVLEYEDAASGEMSSEDLPMRLTNIVLRPRIVVHGASAYRVGRLVRKAHDQCYVANSLGADVIVEPSIETV
ncbi:OsmC family protein [Microbacterium lacus]|uniref:OsmC family protein n=1 Tax=Microbacterium lacus TaxID=415217 RepID=A0ABP4SMZ6_9MICO